MRHEMLMKSAIVILAAFIGIAGCVLDRQASTGETPDMKRAIAEVKGTYTWRGDLGRYEYSERLRLEEILALQPRERAITILIDCLDDASASASTVGDKPVALGLVCYEALTQLVYYEPTEPSGDVAATWPGIISLSASPQDMREAKAAWKKAADAKLLIYQ